MSNTEQPPDVPPESPPEPPPGAFPVSWRGDSVTGYGIRNLDLGWYNHETRQYEAGPFDRAKHYREAAVDPDFPVLRWAHVPAEAAEKTPFSLAWLKARSGIPTPELVEVYDYGASGVSWLPKEKLLIQATLQ